MTDSISTGRLTPGTRVLITDNSEYAGKSNPAGADNLRPAINPRRKSWQTAAGELAGIHAATVERVEPVIVNSKRRYIVHTNMGPVRDVTGGQTFRPAPDDMEDTAALRDRLRAARERDEARKAYDRANPRDVDGTNVAPGDLVETIDQGGGGAAGRPYRVVRAIRPYDVTGGLLVAQPYERAYGDNPAGTGLLLNFRRLVDQSDGPTARRTCGCPATIRDQIIPPPHDSAKGEWSAAVAHINTMSAEDRAHLPGCHWAVRPGPDTRQCLRVLDGWDDAGTVRVFTVHNAAGATAYGTCSCGVEKYSGSLIDVYDRAGAVAAVFPPELHPDRTALPGRVEFATCCTLPMTEPVYIGAARKGIDFHALQGADMARTVCARSTHSGQVRERADVVAEHGSKPCPRCYPDGGYAPATASAPMPVERKCGKGRKRPIPFDCKRVAGHDGDCSPYTLAPRGNHLDQGAPVKPFVSAWSLLNLINVDGGQNL